MLVFFNSVDARMMELVDIPDSKSGAFVACEFESRSGHHIEAYLLLDSFQ